jgi:multidrug efflux system membrane fusion protein
MLLLSGCSQGTPAAGAPAAGGGGGGDKAGRGGPAAVAVTVAPVVVKPMAVKMRAVGNVEASSTVEVRAQVTGELRSVEFTEGQDVRKGQLLFTIDPRPFEAALKQSEAALARDTAQSKNLEAQRARLENLLKSGLVARADYEAAVTSVSAMQASLNAGAATVEQARLQLQYTKILAPIDGRTGALLAHPGSIVRANDQSALVIINQLQPAFVSFAMPARLLPNLRTESGRRRLPVEAVPSGSSEKPSTGTVAFIDNAVDSGSDTIRLKASFPNAERRLWPGAFVDVTLQMSIDPDAIVVPTAAVQPSQQGLFVFVVKSDQTVETRPVKIAWTEGNETVISEGVRPGETVVTDGQLRLTPGAKVSLKPASEGRKGE